MSYLLGSCPHHTVVDAIWWCTASLMVSPLKQLASLRSVRSQETQGLAGTPGPEPTMTLLLTPRFLLDLPPLLDHDLMFQAVKTECEFPSLFSFVFSLVLVTNRKQKEHS